jgi:hypothetical protein
LHQFDLFGGGKCRLNGRHDILEGKRNWSQKGSGSWLPFTNCEMLTDLLIASSCQGKGPLKVAPRIQLLGVGCQREPNWMALDEISLREQKINNP